MQTRRLDRERKVAPIDPRERAFFLSDFDANAITNRVASAVDEEMKNGCWRSRIEDQFPCIYGYEQAGFLGRIRCKSATFSRRGIKLPHVLGRRRLFSHPSRVISRVPSHFPDDTAEVYETSPATSARYTRGSSEILQGPTGSFRGSVPCRAPSGFRIGCLLIDRSWMLDGTKETRNVILRHPKSAEVSVFPLDARARALSRRYRPTSRIYDARKFTGTARCIAYLNSSSAISGLVRPPERMHRALNRSATFDSLPCIREWRCKSALLEAGASEYQGLVVNVLIINRIIRVHYANGAIKRLHRRIKLHRGSVRGKLAEKHRGMFSATKQTLIVARGSPRARMVGLAIMTSLLGNLQFIAHR